MRRILVAFAILLSAGCANFRTATFPPDLSGAETIPPAFNEPSLWRSGDLSGHQMRVRVLFRSIRIHNGIATIRIDHDASGQSRGVVIRGDLGAGEGLINERRSFRVNESDWAQLQQLLFNPRLFEHYPEFWESSDNDAICVDGVDVVLERANSDGYRFSDANITCVAPREFVDVVRELIRLSGDDTLNSFLE